VRSIGARWGGLALALGLATSVVAQTDGDYRIRVYLQPDQEITEQQTVRLVIEADGPVGSNLSVSGLSKLVNLQVVGGPQHEFESSWSNGRMTSRTSVAYTLMPRAAGPAEVPSLSVDVAGKITGTRPIRLDVKPAPAGLPPGRSSGSPRSGAGEGRADVFLRAQLGSTEVWLGESVSLSMLLYRGEQIATPQWAGQPALSSFWVEEIEVDPEGEATRSTVEGRPYVVFPMVRKILVPQTTGKIEIEPFIMQIQVPVRRGDPFERFFSFGRTRSVVRKTQPLTLTVRALPAAGRPDDFSGAVGTFSLEASLDRPEAAVNDAVSLTAAVEGDGFLRAVSPPVLDLPPDIKVFDPKVSSSSRSVRGRLISRKTWEWILVPLVTGEMKIPELRFEYFDTASGAYRTATHDPLALLVRQNGDGPAGSTARGDIRLQRRDLAFIKPLRGTLRQDATRAHKRSLFVALALLPLAWAPVLVFVGRHRAKLQQNLGLARSRRARTRARQRLRAAGKHVESSDAASFHAEVARALVEYVADRFDRAAAGLSYQLADDLLASRGLEPGLRRRFRACLETCDFARFVPSAAATERRAELLSEAGELIEQLEKAC